MSTAITRVYETHNHALAAVSELKQQGFTDDQISVVGAADAGEAGAGAHHAHAADIAHSIANAGVSEAHAQVYAQAVARGGALVTVRAPFGTAAEAIEIVECFHPIDVGLADSDHYFESSSEARLSLGSVFPVLWKGRSSTVLLKGESTTKLLKGTSRTKLLHHTASLSSLLHIPELTRSGKTFGSLLGIPEILGAAKTDSRVRTLR